MELSRKARKENPPKKRKISAFKTVRVSAAISGDRSDQVSNLSARKAAAVASVMAAKDILKKLMDEKEIDSHADIVFGGPTLMDKLTPAEAAMKLAAKPTPTPKKKSSMKPLPLINISAAQWVIGGTVRISNALAELRRASAANKLAQDAAKALVDTDEE